jgi:hypothetical protein
VGNDRIVDVEQDSGAIQRHSQIDKNQSFLARALDVLEKALGSASTQSETTARYSSKTTEDGHCQQVDPTHTPRHSKLGERPGSKNCQAHQ